MGGRVRIPAQHCHRLERQPLCGRDTRWTSGAAVCSQGHAWPGNERGSRLTSGGTVMANIWTLGKVAALVIVQAATAASLASAQSTGAIAGVVRDASGAVLPGVTVEASSPALIE